MSRRTSINASRKRILLLGVLWLLAALVSANERSMAVRGSIAHPPGTLTLTNTAQLRQAADRDECMTYPIRLEGVVLWSTPAQDQLFLQDDTGGLRVQMSLRNQPGQLAGKRIVLEGDCVAGDGGIREALVDNDGLHGPQERSGATYLKAGLHPIRAEWFNGPSTFQFDVEYEGPGIPLQSVPDNALFHDQPGRTGTTTNIEPGISYRFYEGSWEHTPDFHRLTAVKSGTTANFDLGVRTRNEGVGMAWDGYLNVPRDGLYTLWTKSDDGSLFCILDHPLHISVSGTAPLPNPRRIRPNQVLTQDQNCAWTEVEGTVASLHCSRNRELELEILSGTNLIWLHVGDAAGQPPPLFSRIRATGIPCRNAFAGGYYSASRLLVPSLAKVILLDNPPPESGAHYGTVAELRRLASAGRAVVCPTALKGTIMAVDARKGLLVLQDSTGAALIETAARDFKTEPGQIVVLSGDYLADGPKIVLSDKPLVENDGLHLLTERSGSIFLEPGRHSMQLSWFNQTSPGRLTVFYQGPEIWREKIPASSLYHPELDPEKGGIKWVHGLNYRTFKGSWLYLPDLSLLAPQEQGVVSVFDPRTAVPQVQVAWEFSGYIDLPRAGVYTFTVASDDGSRLLVDSLPPWLKVVGTNSSHAPQHLAPRQFLRQDQENLWSAVDGVVTFVNEQSGSLELELSRDSDHMRVMVSDADGSSPQLLLNSRVRALGIAQSTYTTEGYRAAGTLLTASVNEIQILDVASALWTDHPRIKIGQLAGMSFPPTTEAIVRVTGTAQRDKSSGLLRVADDTGQVLVETSQPPATEDGELVDVLGRWSQTETNIVLRCGFYRKVKEEKAHPETALPVLTRVDQITRLTSLQAQRGYPVKIRGVIMAIGAFGDFWIRDSTWAIFVNSRASLNTAPPRVGDYWEVEGVTYGGPTTEIQPHRAVRLGVGTLPEPRRLTWDQVANHSLDLQYVEVRGVVTAIAPDGVFLFTSWGKVKVNFPYLAQQYFQPYLGELIRIRGCLLPDQSRPPGPTPSQIRILSPSFNVDEAAPIDPFGAPLRRASELNDAVRSTDAIERFKVTGQVLCRRGNEYYAQDGSQGLRFRPKESIDLQPGDKVEVVGYLRQDGPAPVLEEALVHRVGHGNLPEVHVLSDDSLLNSRYDGTLVQVRARLMGVTLGQPDQTLELRAGDRRFFARLDATYGFLHALKPDSLLEVTGVYSAHGANPSVGRDIDYFELLVNSPTDIRVLQAPPWWTLGRALAAVGAMSLILLAAFIWITLLRRRITNEVRQHEQTRHLTALERERTRIAKDMHDELGASVTQVSLLGERMQHDRSNPERILNHAKKICTVAMELGQTLDEIVWAVNPRNDTVDKIAAYLALYAEEFFQTAPIRCRIDVPADLPSHSLSAEVRHNLYLATKEALNNIVKHSHASELWMRFRLHDSSFEILIEDNGKGFDTAKTASFGNGVQNMRRRLETIEGHFNLDSAAGRGTQLKFSIALNHHPVA